MRIDPAGFPFIGIALALAALAGATMGWPLAAAFVAIAGFFLFFFRDPERGGRDVPEREVLAPADGRVLVAGPAAAASAPPGAWQQISIFLSPLDVHVNRVPVSGTVTRVVFTRGRFLPAYRDDAATANERSEIWIDHAGQTIVARQIVGILARRVVCRLAVGEQVRAGQRFGIMKFGSRMDVFVPPDATIRVSVGEKVRGGETVLAVLH
ncbi:MAG: phosphatidylserine decarboxylase [Betaproteobacteria bacterium]